MSWYQAGTVSVTADGTTVIGAGTAWVQWSRVGDAFQGPDGRLYEITNVASDTAIAISPSYKGSTAAGQAYTVIPVQGYSKRLADRAAELIADYSDLGTAARGDLQSLSTDYFGPDAPAVTWPGMIWARSTDDTLHRRNVADSAWLYEGLIGDVRYSRKNVLGSVGLANGVPTGALIQRVPTADGAYVKYTDGTVIAYKTHLYPANSTANITGTMGVNMQAGWVAFAQLSGITSGSSGGSFVTEISVAGQSTYSVKALTHAATAISALSGDRYAQIIAIGRFL